MDFQYSQFDGQSFISPDDLFPSQELMQFVMQYGQDALDALENADQPDQVEMIQQWLDAGLLEQDQDGNLKLTPRMLRGLQHKALLDIFDRLQRGTREGHPTQSTGAGDERTDGNRPYNFGDPIHEIDLTATLRRTLQRRAASQKHIGLPLELSRDDLELHETQGRSDVALCVLLDMSGSMMRWDRFYHAKRVALGLVELMRSRFPQDTVDFVGFHSMAEVIRPDQLPLVMPKPISVRDHRVRLRVSLDQAKAQPQSIPEHFTNLHLGLRLARQILARRGAANKQMFIITDGQPTAHVEPNPAGGETLYLLYPPTQQTQDVTLKEALRCQQQGIRMASFALIEDYYGMDWVNFIEQLTRLTRGTAFYCSGDDLSSTVIESYLSGRKKKSFIA